MTFNAPARSSVQEFDPELSVPFTGLEFDDAYIVSPRSKKQRVAAFVFIATPDSQTWQEFAEELQDEFAESGLRVSSLKVDSRKSEIKGTLTGAGEVPWRSSEVKTSASFRVVELPDEGMVAGVIAFSESKNFGKSFSRPFRQIVAAFKTGVAANSDEEQED